VSLSSIIVTGVIGILLLLLHALFFGMGSDMFRWKSRIWPVYFCFPLLIDALIYATYLASQGK